MHIGTKGRDHEHRIQPWEAWLALRLPLPSSRNPHAAPSPCLAATHLPAADLDFDADVTFAIKTCPNLLQQLTAAAAVADDYDGGGGGGDARRGRACVISGACLKQCSAAEMAVAVRVGVGLPRHHWLHAARLRCRARRRRQRRLL